MFARLRCGSRIFAEVLPRGGFFVKFEVSQRQQFASDPDSVPETGFYVSGLER